MSESQPQSQVAEPWEALRGGGVWRAPLPWVDRWADRLLLRLAGALACRQLAAVDGLALALPAADPFILAANHGSRREAIYLPALLLLARGGRPVHFLADWNFRLIPGVGYLYDRAGAITVVRKPARPAILDRFRSRYLGAPSALGQAAARLASGAPVALFPEGTVTRDSRSPPRPRPGAVRLALESGAPLLPLGIRHGGPHGQGRLSLRFGNPYRLATPAPGCLADPGLVRAQGADLMARIRVLAGI